MDIDIMIIKTCTPLAATETINFLWKYSKNFIITLYRSVLLHKSDFMLIRCLSKHLLVAGHGIKYDTLRLKTCICRCFPRCAVRIFNSKWGVISDRYNKGGIKWTVVFECCSWHSSKGNAVNGKKCISMMNLLHYGGKVARKALT